MSLYFITGNAGKFKEAQAILSELKQLNIDLIEIQGLDPRKVIRAKLIKACQHHDGEFIVEDISLFLDCLNGLPGPLIKWFLKTLGTKGIYDLTEKYGNYNVEARAIIGYSKNKDNIKYFEGKIQGTITPPRGSGFGWDPIFMPQGFNKTFGEMTAEEKNQISMRKMALEDLKNYLNSKK